MHCLNTQTHSMTARIQSNNSQSNTKNPNDSTSPDLTPDNSKSPHNARDPLQIPINQLRLDNLELKNQISDLKIEKFSVELKYESLIHSDKLSPEKKADLDSKLANNTEHPSVSKRTATELEIFGDDIISHNDSITKIVVLEEESKEPKTSKISKHKSNEDLTSSISSDSEDLKHRNRITMSQNYKSTLTRGFLRVVKNIKDDAESLYYRFLNDYINDNKKGIPSLSAQSTKTIAKSIMDYIVDKIQGKGSKRKKSKTKVGNVKVIHSIFFPKRSDDEGKVFKKKASHSLLLFFLRPENFENWVRIECNSNEGNKKFLLENLDEMRKVFEDPLNYKADFNSK